MKKNKKASKHHKSDLKKAEVVIDRNIYILYSLLEKLVNFYLPEDVLSQIRDLYYYINDKYFNFIAGDYDIEDDYITYTIEYREYLD